MPTHDHASPRGATPPARLRTTARAAALAAVVFTTLLTGCQTPPVARDLSKAQIATMESAEKAYATYTAAVLEFATRAATAAEAQAKASYDKHRTALLADLKDDPTTLVAEIEAAKQRHDETVARVRQNLELLRTSTQQLATFWPGLITAQRQIDTYLGTPRNDQVIAGEILGSLKLDQAQLEARAKTIADKIITLTTP